MYRLKLELDGYTVDIAGDGLSALERARSQHPDIIFLDIRLPKLDGLAVLEQLRADAATAGIPVVILSNWNEKELVERGISLGALDHLIKSQTTPARLSSRPGVGERGRGGRSPPPPGGGGGGGGGGRERS